jgi:hypothetical protein
VSPLLNIAVLFAFGLGLGLAFPVPFAAAIAASLLAVLTTTASMLQKKMVGLSLAALVTVAGWIRPNEPDYRGDTSPSAPCTRVVEGTVTSPPVLLKEHQRMDIDLSRWSDCLDTPVIGRLSKVKGRLFVWTPRDMDDLPRRGDRIRLRARIKPVLTRRNPGTPKWRPAEPLYSASLFRRDAFSTVGVSDATVRQAFDKWLRIVSLSITGSFPTETAPLARALLLGESAALTQSQRATFRRTGTAHLVSVSGLHLGLVALFFF